MHEFPASSSQPVQCQAGETCKDGASGEAAPVLLGARMRHALDRAGPSVQGKSVGASPSSRTLEIAGSPAPAEHTVIPEASAPHWLCALESWLGEVAAAPKCRCTFQTALLSTILASTILACLAMLVPVAIVHNNLVSELLKSIEEITHQHQVELRTLINDNVTGGAYNSALGTIRGIVNTSVLWQVQSEMDTLWMFMLNQQRMTSWTAKLPYERMVIANLSYLQINADWRHSLYNPFSRWMKVSWETGEQTACSMTQNASKMQPLVFAYDKAANSNRTKWAIDRATGQRIEPPLLEMDINLRDPGYLIQVEVGKEATSMPGPLRRMWSPLWNFYDDGQLGLSWTAPIAYCGNYSCMEGVMSVEITVSYISSLCAEEHVRLRTLLSMAAYKFPIGETNSSVFIVNHVSKRAENQQGLLIGASQFDGKSKQNVSNVTINDQTQATDSPQKIVQATSLAIKLLFGAWNATALESDQLFNFNVGAVSRGVRPEPKGCGSDQVYGNSAGDDGDCMMAGTTSIDFGEGTRWLVVVVLPVGAFSSVAEQSARTTEEKVQVIHLNLVENINFLRMVGILVSVAAVLVCISIGVILSFLISRRLSFLAKHMLRLGNLDLKHESKEFVQLRLGTRSRIEEVCNLQNAFCRLYSGIEAFARFVPETVVQHIVQGDPLAGSLHVSHRRVTIMFSDIRDFTSIAETLSQDDLLTLLTRYFSEMTIVIERYGGVVAEILGDGLLIFWNTPGDVQDHELKACRAALGQQRAMVKLNAELERRGPQFPQLGVRMGIHTGLVLSGNIGSERKMKFGCIGDPVNTASRLEGLCKVYGVGVVCSEATREAIPANSGLLCRRLDLVQVKGKQLPMCVWEVIGEEAKAPEARALQERARRYEAGLTAYQQARFEDAVCALTQLLEESPGDVPTARLLALAREHWTPEGRCPVMSEAAMSSWSCVSRMNEK